MGKVIKSHHVLREAWWDFLEIKTYKERMMDTLGEKIAEILWKVLPVLRKVFAHTKDNEEVVEQIEDRKVIQNIFGPREEVDNEISLDERLGANAGVRMIRILNYASNAILTPENTETFIPNNPKQLAHQIENLACSGKVNIIMVITAPDSEAAKEALRNEKVINAHLHKNEREHIFYSSYAALQEKIAQGGIFFESYKKGRFIYRLTEVSLPYAIFQVIYEDESKDYIKLDLYSPYIVNERKRRSVYIYKDKNPRDYTFFADNFDSIYNASMSKEEELAHRQEWIDKYARHNAKEKESFGYK